MPNLRFGSDVDRDDRTSFAADECRCEPWKVLPVARFDAGVVQEPVRPRKHHLHALNGSMNWSVREPIAHCPRDSTHHALCKRF